MGAMEAKGRRIREGCSQDCIEWMNTTRTDKYSAVFSDIICIDFSLVVKTEATFVELNVMKWKR